MRKVNMKTHMKSDFKILENENETIIMLFFAVVLLCCHFFNNYIAIFINQKIFCNGYISVSCVLFLIICCCFRSWDELLYVLEDMALHNITYTKTGYEKLIDQCTLYPAA